MLRKSACSSMIFALALGGIAFGDGMMAPTSARPELAPMEAGQKAILIDDGVTETILFQVTYRGPRNDFAWVIPVPGKPGPQGVDEGSQWFLDYVQALTSPVVVTEGPRSSRSAQMSGMSGMGAPPAGRAAGRAAPSVPPPRVIEDRRLDVGPYQVSVLEATGKGVLGDWLRAHGFVIPAGADRDLDGYVGRGW